LQDHSNIKRGQDKTEGSNKLDENVKRGAHSVLKRVSNLHMKEHESAANIMEMNGNGMKGG
jgi:hypothetical protein